VKAGGPGKKKSGGKSLPEAERPPLVSRRGWRFVAAGAVIVAAGYVLLGATDAAGRNAASVASPLLVMSGYGVIAFGTIAREKS